MKLAMAYFYPGHEEKIPLAQQLGVDRAVINVCGQRTPLPKAGGWDFTPFRSKVKVFLDAGIKPEVVEGPTPLERTKLGLSGRDEEIAAFCELLEVMDELDIRTVCYNWMPVIGWFRSRTDIPTRGGATVTGYCHEDVRDAPFTEYGKISAKQLWENLEYFLKAVVPQAEKHHIRLAVHPDDPPVKAIRGISRILISPQALRKVTELVPSAYNGITLCQGSIGAAGADVAETLESFARQEKIFFAHFRDIRGTAENFRETFHDDGQTDMYRCMKLYYKYGLDCCIRPDHVPTMPGEICSQPGYSVLGNLFAVGYMKGLMEAAEKETGGNKDDLE